MIVPNSPLPPAFPQAPAASGALRRCWPTAAGVVAGLLVAAVIASDLAATVRLIGPAPAFWTRIAALALLAALGVVGVVLERLRLVEKSKPAAPALDEPPLARPPPPINEPAAAPATGQDLPEALSGAGAKVSWRLEGGFVWRPPYNEP